MNSAERMQPEPSAKELSGWGNILLLVLVNVVIVAGLFASVRTTTEEHTQQIRDLQQNSVTRREMDDFKGQLRRIEDKLDQVLKDRK